MQKIAQRVALIFWAAALVAPAAPAWAQNEIRVTTGIVGENTIFDFLVDKAGQYRFDFVADLPVTGMVTVVMFQQQADRWTGIPFATSSYSYTFDLATQPSFDIWVARDNWWWSFGTELYTEYPTQISLAATSGIGAAYSLTVTRIPGVPEPAAWAMMIGGFGVAGAALRRRSVKVAFG